MQRDIFLLDGPMKLNEFLQELRVEDSTEDSCLGVGFFKAVPASSPHQGVEILVSPTTLKPMLLEHIAKGHVSPFENQTVFLGIDSKDFGAPAQLEMQVIPRWLLLGLNRMRANRKQEKRERSSQGNQDKKETLLEIVNVIFSKIMEVRPHTVILVVDTPLLVEYIHEVDSDRAGRAQSKEALRESFSTDIFEFAEELLTYIIDETSHPRVAIVCRTSGDYKAYLEAGYRIVRTSRHGNNLNFRL